MALLLDAQDLRRALPYPFAVQVIEAGFRAFANGEYVMPQRLMLSTNGNFLAAMPAANRANMSVKIATVNPHNVDKGLPSVQAVVVLLESNTGEVISVLDGTSLTVIRTAAASAAATNLLANPGPIRLGVLGTGPQAIEHVLALAATKELKSVTMFSPRASMRWPAILKALETLEAPVILGRDARGAVEHADVLVLVTSSATPVLRWEWVRPGTHVNAVGSHTPAARELDGETLHGSRVVCDSVEACWTEAGDLIQAHAEGSIDRDHADTSLGDVFIGRKTGRADRDQVTVFKSVGLAFQDLCIAIAAFEQARGASLGRYWNPSGLAG
jgi:ornithine cyclodeaminase